MSKNLMDAILSSEFRMEPHRPVNIVIGYERSRAGHHAMQWCARLIQNESRNFQFNTSLWKFDVLALPNLRQQAKEDLAEADILVIAAGPDVDLPHQVKLWIAYWASAKRPAARALVGVLESADPPAEEESPVHSYLQRTVREANIDFVWHTVSAPGTRWELSENALPASDPSAFSLDEEIPVASTSRHNWGINE